VRQLFVAIQLLQGEPGLIGVQALALLALAFPARRHLLSLVLI
jgi:hypothetical protein